MSEIKKKIKNMLFNVPLLQWYVTRNYPKDKIERLPCYEQSAFRRCYYKKNKLSQYENMFKNIQIQIKPGKRFQHWIDVGYFFINKFRVGDILSPNYRQILDYSINDIIEINSKNNDNVSKCSVGILKSVSEYIDRIIKEIEKTIDDCKNSSEAGIGRLEKTRIYFERMINEPCITFEEGLQRILFWSSIFWQSNHIKIGLGRLDCILDRLQMPETIEETDSIISDFYDELHNYYAYKSSILLGDTGQVIILGGKKPDGSYFYNLLTKAFLTTLKRKKITDPKIVLRVSNNMPDEVLETAVDCISTGIGSPLLSNDEVVIPALINFGYDTEDAYDYIVSACWETLSYGRSWGRGNLASINFGQVIVDTYNDDMFLSCSTFDDIVEIYKKHLKKRTMEVVKILNGVKQETDPLMSLFTEGCRESKKDFSEGGAKYHDFGVLTVGIANAIDSLSSMHYVTEETDSITLEEVFKAVKNNYECNENLRNLLVSKKVFGKENDFAINLISESLSVIDNCFKDYVNPFGGRVKYGLSSFDYMHQGEICDATWDGRKNKEPLSYHIAATSNVAYTELFRMAGSLDYTGIRSNASVIDIIVSPFLIINNKEKFIQLIKGGITCGFFELQVNVLNSGMLIDAKNNPEKYKDLVVRVWGFSAFFNDLPDDYKDLLIKRAKEGEQIA